MQLPFMSCDHTTVAEAEECHSVLQMYKSNWHAISVCQQRNNLKQSSRCTDATALSLTVQSVALLSLRPLKNNSLKIKKEYA